MARHGDRVTAPRKRLAWAMIAGYALAMVGLALAYLTAGGPVARIVLSSVPTALPALAIVTGMVMHRPARRAPWLLLAAQAVVLTVGAVVLVVQDRIFDGHPPPPSPADAALLSVYPLIVVALLLVVKARTPGRDMAALLDALILTVSIGTLSWVFLIAPYLHDSNLGMLARVTSATYPLMDLLLLAMLARLVFDRGRRGTAYLFMIGWLVLTLVNDSCYVVSSIAGTWRPDNPVVVLVVLANIALGAAALHPSMVELTQPAPVGTAKVTRVRVGALLGLAILVAPLLLTLQHVLDEPISVVGVIAASVTLCVLAMLRMGSLVQSLRRAMRQNEWWAQRESILRRAAADLVAAVTPDQIAAIATTAGADLVDRPGTELHAVVCEELDELPEAVRAALGSEPQVVATSVLGLTAPVLLLPLRAAGELVGALATEGADEVPPHVTEALQALAGQAALALESVELAESLHRQQNDERFQRLVQHAFDVITVVDEDLVVRYQTASVAHVLGYGPDALVGEDLIQLIHPDDVPLVVAAISGVLAEQSAARTLECRFRRADGRYLITETIAAFAGDQGRRCVLTTRDITERKALEQQLKHQAFHDGVTGLANRALFIDRTHHALERRGLADAPLAVLHLDLDDFHTVNESLGHEGGDELLRAVANRLRTCIRPSDTPARLGGDEFAILLEDLHDETEATRIAERALAALAAPLVLRSREISIQASIGVALVNNDRAAAAEDLLRDAETAMYTAKRQGKGRYACFAPSMHEALAHKLELTAELRRAVEHQEFAVHYQPIVDLADGSVHGVEALVRWQHPTRGVVSPTEFISLSEKTGLIVPIGRYVLEEACAQAARWQHAYGQPLVMNVNLSVRQLQDPDLLADVERALRTNNLPSRTLCLEITETFLADEAPDATELLRRLKGLGVLLAIDDFGTGYSSLSRLQQFPLDILKIAKPFVDGLTGGAPQSGLARAISDIAGTLELEVVAEGIEDAEQWAALRRLSCRYGQGFYFARPGTARQTTALLTDRLRAAGPKPGSRDAAAIV